MPSMDPGVALAGNMFGADIAQLQVYGTQLVDSSETIEKISNHLTSLVESSRSWVGVDADIFRVSWSSNSRPTLTMVAQKLAEASEQIELQAQQQVEASMLDGGGNMLLSAEVLGAMRDMAGDVSSVIGGIFGAFGGIGGNAEVPAPGFLERQNGRFEAFMANPWKDLHDAVSGAKDVVDGVGLIKDLKQAGGAISKFFDDSAGTAIGGLKELEGLGAATSVLGKLGAGWSIYEGVRDVIDPKHEGLWGVGDRVAGGLSVVAGGGTLLLSSATAAAFMGPVAPFVIAGAGIAAGVWTAGSYVADNWNSITGFVQNPMPYISDGIENIGHGFSNVTSAVHDTLETASNAVDSVADWVKDGWNGITGGSR